MLVYHVTDASGLQEAWLGDWWYQLWGTYGLPLISIWILLNVSTVHDVKPPGTLYFTP